MSSIATDEAMLTPARNNDSFRIPRKTPKENEASQARVVVSPKAGNQQASWPSAKKTSRPNQRPNQRPFHKKNWISAPRKGASEKEVFAAKTAREMAVSEKTRKLIDASKDIYVVIFLYVCCL